MAKPAKASRPAPAELAQDARAFDQSRQAILGAGQQNNYFGERDRPPEPTISVAPPYGQRANLPLRGRDQLLTVLTDPRPAGRVHVVHGLGGCGKTRLALEVAHLAEQASFAAEEPGFANLGVGIGVGIRIGIFCRRWRGVGNGSGDRSQGRRSWHEYHHFRQELPHQGQARQAL